MIGLVFGRLTVVGMTVRQVGKARKLNLTHAVCKCGCGNTREVQPSALRLGKCISCGCYSAEETVKRGTTHGRSYSPEYRAWNGMKQRCFNPKARAYSDYGGRGISVCERWATSFEAFFEDMGERPAGMTLERSDNNKGYEPGNVVWATRLDQISNRRVTRNVELNGKTVTLKAACTILGLNFKTVSERLRRGWSAERALTPSLWNHAKKENFL